MKTPTTAQFGLVLLALLLVALPTPAMADAGVGNDAVTSPDGITTSPDVEARAGSPVEVADPVEQPARALEDVRLVHERGGLWAAIGAALLMLGRAIGKRAKPGSPLAFLGRGRWAAGLSAATAAGGALLDWQLAAQPGQFMAFVGVVLLGSAVLVNPELMPREEAGISAKNLGTGGGKSGGGAA